MIPLRTNHTMVASSILGKLGLIRRAMIKVAVRTEAHPVAK
jgi:hypothetical protein